MDSLRTLTPEKRDQGVICLCIHPEGWSEEDKDQVLLLVKSQAVNRFKLQKENSSLKIKKII